MACEKKAVHKVTVHVNYNHVKIKCDQPNSNEHPWAF